MNPEFVVLIAVLYVILNGVTLILFWSDKRKAVRNSYRIRESTLLIWGLIGPFGALAGMKAFRHKTQKMKFKAIYLFLVLHLILIFFLVWKFVL